MKITEIALTREAMGAGTFALPPLDPEITDAFHVMRVHFKAEGCPLWWRRDGEAHDERTSFRIANGQTRSIDDPAQIPSLRFAFDGDAGALRVVYEGRAVGEWLQERRAMTIEEFAGPIKAANAGAEQGRTPNCVSAVVATNPDAVIPQAPLAQAEAHSPEVQAVIDASQQQMLAKHAALVTAVRGSWSQ